jgi:hypothetical protein
VYTLITAANSSQAYKLKNTLDSESVLLGEYLELPELLIQSGKVLKLPDPESVTYIHEMLALCLDKEINNIYALRREEEQLLLNAKQLFGEYNINMQTPNDKI